MGGMGVRLVPFVLPHLFHSPCSIGAPKGALTRGRAAAGAAAYQVPRQVRRGDRGAGGSVQHPVGSMVDHVPHARALPGASEGRPPPPHPARGMGRCSDAGRRARANRRFLLGQWFPRLPLLVRAMFPPTHDASRTNAPTPPPPPNAHSRLRPARSQRWTTRGTGCARARRPTEAAAGAARSSTTTSRPSSAPPAPTSSASAATSTAARAPRSPPPRARPAGWAVGALGA
jgi:hypothetical protein